MKNGQPALKTGTWYRHKNNRISILQNIQTALQRFCQSLLHIFSYLQYTLQLCHKGSLSISMMEFWILGKLLGIRSTTIQQHIIWCKNEKKKTNSKICKNLFSIAFSYLSSDCTVSDYHCLPQCYMACISEKMPFFFYLCMYV